MIKLRVSRRRTLPILVVLLLASSLMPTVAARLISHVPTSVVSALLTPVKPHLHQLALTIRSPRSQGPVEAEIDLNDYEKLKRLYWRKELELREAYETIERLSLLRRDLNLSATKLLEVAVASSQPHPLYPSISISKGTTRGIEVRQVVGAGHDLVGRISHASATSATVDLVCRSETHLEVLILPKTINGEPRRAKCQLKFDADRDRFVDILGANRADLVREGDVARLADPRWPKHAQGLIVGAVEAIENLSDDVRQKRVIVRSRVDLIRLSKVVVMMPEGGH